MRVGVIADTHLPRKGSVELPEIVHSDLQKTDLILHAGDFKTKEAWETIRNLGPPLEAVTGNVDSPELTEILGTEKVVEAKGFRIGLTHGHGNRKTTRERAWATFEQDRVDVIVYGHSHIPFVGVRDGVLVLNPGSPTDKRRNPRFSYAILELGSFIEPEIRYFK